MFCDTSYAKNTVGLGNGGILVNSFYITISF